MNNPLAHLLPDNAKSVEGALNASLANGADSISVGNAGASSNIPVTPQEDDAMNERAEILAAAPFNFGALTTEIRHEEWRITVKGHPLLWASFCLEHNLKPLFIELSNRSTQLMCVSAFDPRALIHELLDENERPLFTILRVKHVVSALQGDESALYWEAHANFNGPFRADRKGTSRDLYRAHEQRWYMTYRSRGEFHPEVFTDRAITMSRPSTFAKTKYEACILDTNMGLDAGWL